MHIFQAIWMAYKVRVSYAKQYVITSLNHSIKSGSCASLSKHTVEAPASMMSCPRVDDKQHHNKAMTSVQIHTLSVLGYMAEIIVKSYGRKVGLTHTSVLQ